MLFKRKDKPPATEPSSSFDLEAWADTFGIVNREALRCSEFEATVLCRLVCSEQGFNGTEPSDHEARRIFAEVARRLGRARIAGYQRVIIDPIRYQTIRGTT